MAILYDIGIRIYSLLIYLAALWNPKARKWIRGRSNWRHTLSRAFSRDDKVIWIHCASLGEFEQGRPILDKVAKEVPGHKILLTFFSPSGFEKQKNYSKADQVVYLPADTFLNARDFLAMVPVSAAFFIKYEFWYNYLNQLYQKNIPTYLVSGHFREEQLFFRWYGGWYRKFLSRFTHIFVQHESSRALLAREGISNVTVAGDTRFDRVLEIVSGPGIELPAGLFANDLPVIICGSTWEKDEMILRRSYDYFRGKINWVIAPHETSRQNMDRISAWFPEGTIFSAMLSGETNKGDMVIVDTIGHLSMLYRYGDMAYIGGGFGKGIHNILEASASGLPVMFGPNYHKFREASDLCSEGAANVVEQLIDLNRNIEEFISNPQLLKKAAQNAEKYTHNHAGASVKIVDFVFKRMH